MNKSKLLALALVLAGIPAAHAADSMYGALMGSYVVRDPDLETDNGPGVFGLLGWPINSHLNIEANLFGARNDFSHMHGTASSFGLGADANIPLPGARAWPFLLAGLGVQRDDFTDAPDGNNENSPFLDLGIGVQMPLNDTLGLRAEIREYAIKYDNYPGPDVAFDSRLNVGLAFGGSGKAAAKPAKETPVAAAAAAPAAKGLDSDGDGVPDNKDKCPDTSKGQSVDSDGCVLLANFKLSGVSFATNSDKLQPAAKLVLDGAVSALKAHPEAKVEIAGYTDSTGSPERNKQLSQQRADSVRAYLIEKGVNGDRLSAKGYGPDNPIDTNKTAAGRANNRRVEFHVH